MITKRLLAQNDNEVNQILNVDVTVPYIVNTSSDWQMLFNRNSSISEIPRILKIAAQLDPSDFDKIRVIGYLFNPKTGNADKATSCSFKIHKVENPIWTEQLLHTENGAEQANHYFLISVDQSSLSSANINGEDSLMIEVTAVRKNKIFKDRIYANHLGIYDSYIRLKRKVQFLDATKLDE